jgi:Ca-activated chloride channel family protein
LITIDPGTSKVSIDKDDRRVFKQIDDLFDSGSFKGGNFSVLRTIVLLKAKPIKINIENTPGQSDIFYPEFLKPIFENQAFVDSDLPGVVIAWDVSGSMLAEDFKPKNRFETAKAALIEFIKTLKGTRVEIKVFAREVKSVIPAFDIKLPLAEKTVKDIEAVQIGIVPDGTAIGNVLFESVQELKKSLSTQRHIVLLTDGDSNAGYLSPMSAADFAKQDQVVIDIIGLGKGGLVDFPVVDPIFGKKTVQVEMNVDHALLEEIAQSTNGKYYKAESAAQLKASLEDILKRLKKEQAASEK